MKRFALCAVIAALAFPVVTSEVRSENVFDVLRHDWMFAASFSAMIGADACLAYAVALKAVRRMPPVINESAAFAAALRVMLATVVAEALYYGECYLVAYGLYYHPTLAWDAVAAAYAAYFVWPVFLTVCATTAFVSYVAPEKSEPP